MTLLSFSVDPTIFLLTVVLGVAGLSLLVRVVMPAIIRARGRSVVAAATRMRAQVALERRQRWTNAPATQPLRPQYQQSWAPPDPRDTTPPDIFEQDAAYEQQQRQPQKKRTGRPVAREAFG